MTIGEVAEKVKQLHELLQDPQPGLFTWGSMVSDAWRDVKAAMEPSKQEGSRSPKFFPAPEGDTPCFFE